MQSQAVSGFVLKTLSKPLEVGSTCCSRHLLPWRSSMVHPLTTTDSASAREAVALSSRNAGTAETLYPRCQGCYKRLGAEDPSAWS